MNNLYQRIKNGISCLPESDREIASNLIHKRDFESLLELVSSCLTMKKKDSNKEVPSPKWEVIDANALEVLELDISEYISYLDDTVYVEDQDEFY